MFGGSSIEQQPAGHAQVHRQRALIELHEDELAAPLDRLNRPISQAASEQLAISWCHEALRKRRRDDAAAGQMRRERADDGFNLRKFWHD